MLEVTKKGPYHYHSTECYTGNKSEKILHGVAMIKLYVILFFALMQVDLSVSFSFKTNSFLFCYIHISELIKAIC